MNRRFRKGSSYILVMAVASVATIAAFASLSISTANRNKSELELDFVRANLSLQSALDVAMEAIQADTNWRTTYSSNTSSDTAVEVVLSQTTLKWYITDPVDGNLTNNSADPVRIHAIGEFDDCKREISTLAFPSGRALEILRSPLHATGNITLNGSVVASKGPLSTDSQISGNSNSVFGDIEAASTSGLGNAYHSNFSVAGTKTLPSHLVFEAYQSIATQVDVDTLDTPFTIEDSVVSNHSAPSSGTETNPNGLYFVEVPSATTLEIKNTKITGTVLIKLTGSQAKLKIGEGVYWHPHRKDFPSLIVMSETDTDNDVEIQCTGTFTHPIGGNQVNASLNGVFHVMRPATPTSTTTISAPRPIRGTVLVEGDALIGENSLLMADTDLLDAPVRGYQTELEFSSLLENQDFNNGASPWYPNGGNFRAGGTKIQRSTASNDGSNCVKISNRNSSRSGIVQNITHKMESGLSAYGYVSARMEDQDETLIVALQIVDDSGTSRTTLATRSATTSWNSFYFSLSPSWTGTLHSAKLFIYSQSTNQDFYLDDVNVSLSTTYPRTRFDVFPASISIE